MLKENRATIAAHRGRFQTPFHRRTAVPVRFDTILNDSFAALMRGFKAISIMSFDHGGILPNWHWHTDTVEHISEDNLLDAAALAAYIVERIEECAAEEAER